MFGMTFYNQKSEPKVYCLNWKNEKTCWVDWSPQNKYGLNLSHLQTTFKNIVAKGEIAHDDQFLHLQCFRLYWTIVCSRWYICCMLERVKTVSNSNWTINPYRTSLVIKNGHAKDKSHSNLETHIVCGLLVSVWQNNWNDSESLSELYDVFHRY